MSTTGELLKAANVKGAKREARREARREWFSTHGDVKLAGIGIAVAVAFVVAGITVMATSNYGGAQTVGACVISVGAFGICAVADLIVCNVVIRTRR